MKREYRNNVEDTTKSTPVTKVGPGITKAGSEAILDQEARGAAQLALSEVLPTSGIKDPVLPLWGIEVGNTVPNDPIFTHVKLPPGWTKVPGEPDPRHIKLVDDKGRTRASIFYKAAFYDRGASMHSCKRFNVRRDYSDACPSGVMRLNVIGDDNKVLFTSDEHKDPTKVAQPEQGAWEKREAIEKELYTQCQAWLDTHYPNNADPVKSWED